MTCLFRIKKKLRSFNFYIVLHVDVFFMLAYLNINKLKPDSHNFVSQCSSNLTEQIYKRLCR